LSKYGMSMCTLGMSAEFASDGIAVNSLWPKTLIATAAIKHFFPEEIYLASRKPDIVSGLLFHIITSNSRITTGNFFMHEDVLRKAGVSDFTQYALDPKRKPFPDFFLDQS